MMRYLKSFNESVDLQDELDELRDFCQGYLAYLLDDGFRVSIPSMSRALIRMKGEGMLLLPPNRGESFHFYGQRLRIILYLSYIFY